MKKWIPDYANRDTTNIVTTTYTATQDGFINYKLGSYSGGDSHGVYINGVRVYAIETGAGNVFRTISDVFPITTGDTVSFSYNRDAGNNWAYFMPGRWV